MAKLKIDKRVASALVLVLLAGTIMGSQVNDARDDAAAEWERLTYREQCVFATAALVGASYALVRLQTVSPTLQGVTLDYWLPYGMTNAEAVDLVNAVYSDSSMRKIPYIGIILEPNRFRSKSGSSGW